MTTNHTPGPWCIAFGGLQGDGYATIGAKLRREPIAEMNQHRGGNGEGELIANARLIAAAPELLAALEGLFNDWLTLVNVDLNENNPDALALEKQARAALRKAGVE